MLTRRFGCTLPEADTSASRSRALMASVVTLTPCSRRKYTFAPTTAASTVTMASAMMTFFRVMKYPLPRAASWRLLRLRARRECGDEKCDNQIDTEEAHRDVARAPLVEHGQPDRQRDQPPDENQIDRHQQDRDEGGFLQHRHEHAQVGARRPDAARRNSGQDHPCRQHPGQGRDHSGMHHHGEDLLERPAAAHHHREDPEEDAADDRY